MSVDWLVHQHVDSFITLTDKSTRRSNPQYLTLYRDCAVRKKHRAVEITDVDKPFVVDMG